MGLWLNILLTLSVGFRQDSHVRATRAFLKRNLEILKIYIKNQKRVLILVYSHFVYFNITHKYQKIAL